MGERLPWPGRSTATVSAPGSSSPEETAERRPRSCGLREAVGEDEPIDHDRLAATCVGQRLVGHLAQHLANVSGS